MLVMNALCRLQNSMLVCDWTALCTMDNQQSAGGQRMEMCCVEEGAGEVEGQK